MKANTKILNATKFAGGSVLALGMMMFLIGIVSDFALWTSIGIGTVTGAVFIFLIGLFFAATEEMLGKSIKGTKETSPLGKV
ncbi:hypothetical protein [Pseudalkalibacillus berkeleyi]|uniref:Uncharacterized protein n=1 Tax=Pseudalkalibacillus berkeleyi TaxID=1069813 RepID=A0ABS9GV27_9BACL|nr:hypothetical protein [Pseudalkalibacillus berkeleyi]MCF6136539.1 hypothetical protein [Pseudalkalibacillus berkeleyi]